MHHCRKFAVRTEALLDRTADIALESTVNVAKDLKWKLLITKLTNVKAGSLDINYRNKSV